MRNQFSKGRGLGRGREAMLTFHDFGIKCGLDGKHIASKPVMRVVRSHGVRPEEKGKDLLELYDDIQWLPAAFFDYPENTVVVIRETEL
jgi:hypothetical protein